MEPLFSILKSVVDGSRNKLVTFIGIVVVVAVFLIGYERFSASVRIGRLQKETALLAQLQEVQAKATNSLSPELIQQRNILLKNVSDIIGESRFSLRYVPSKLTLSYDTLWKFLSASGLWAICGFYFLFKKKTTDYKHTFWGYISLAIICGIAGVFMRPIWWPWFHIFFFPWLFVIGLLILLTPFFVFATNFQKAKKVATTNACHNNLRQIDAAKNQWALENNKDLNALPTELDLKMYLKDGIVPKCPSGGTYAINSVGRSPSCSFAGHDFHLHEGPIAAAKRKAKAIDCINNLKQVGLAARIWSHDHNDILPADFDSMKAELNSDKITHCSAGESAKYVILSPGISSSDPTVVFAKCPIHDHVVLVDGSVQELKNRQLVQKDGKWLIDS